MPTKIIKNSYNAGELSEYMAGRTDINKYHNGCSKLTNATVLPHGGVVKRSGTEYIGKAPNKARLLPFEFSVDDALVLEFSNLLIRFYKDGDRVYEDDIEIASTTEDNPVLVTTDAAHGLSDNDWVYLEDIDTATSLNDKIYQITVTGAGGVTKFTLQDTEGNDIDGTGIGGGGALGSCKRVYQIVSPYTSAQAFEVHVTQSADVMYLAHKDHPPQKLSRAGDTDWTIADVVFTGGPFLTENLTAANLMGFARTGGTARSGYYFPTGATGTLTATGGHTPFLGTANDVGTLWQVNHTRPDNILKTADNDGNTTPAGAGIRIEGDYTFQTGTFRTAETVILWRKEGNGSWQEERTFLSATSLSATEENKDVFYTFTRDVSGGGETSVSTLTAKNQINKGIVKVTAASSTTVATVIVVDAVLSNNSSDAAVTTSMWAEGSWGKFRGYPRTVSFFEDRLWWASSTNNPDTLWGSSTSEYEDHSVSGIGIATDSMIVPINDNEVSSIQWMQARQVMAVGAANKEYRFGNPDPDKSATPEPGGAKSTPQTSFGSNEIQPVVLNDAVFYFQRQGRKLRAMKFDVITENFQATDATLIANTILESPPTTMAVQRVPDSIIWITRADGVLLSFTYEPDEEVSGWARHITGAMSSNILNGTVPPTELYESVTVIHGTTEDEVWVSVQRIIDGVTVRYIEKFSTRIFDQLDEANMLDSALTNVSGAVSGDLILASDTVRFGSGVFGSSLFGGTT